MLLRLLSACGTYTAPCCSAAEAPQAPRRQCKAAAAAACPPLTPGAPCLPARPPQFPKVQPKVAYGSLDGSGGTSSDEEPVVGLDGRPAGSAAQPASVV